MQPQSSVILLSAGKGSRPFDEESAYANGAFLFSPPVVTASSDITDLLSKTASRPLMIPALLCFLTPGKGRVEKCRVDCESGYSAFKFPTGRFLLWEPGGHQSYHITEQRLVPGAADARTDCTISTTLDQR